MTKPFTYTKARAEVATALTKALTELRVAYFANVSASASLWAYLEMPDALLARIDNGYAPGVAHLTCHSGVLEVEIQRRRAKADLNNEREVEGLVKTYLAPYQALAFVRLSTRLRKALQELLWAAQEGYLRDYRAVANELPNALLAASNEPPAELLWPER